jgi:DNA-binding NarL/FixJ family response regulator
VLHELLRTAGVDVVATGRPRDGVEDPADAVPSGVLPQLVVVLSGTTVDGLVDLALWRACCPGVPLLLVVERLDLDWVPAAVRAGADGVLAVGTNPAAFARSVAALLRGEPAVPRGAVGRLVDAIRDAPVQPAGRVALLSPRELHVLRRLAVGLGVADVAHEAGVEESTVRSQLSRAVHKLRVRDRTEAIAVLAAALSPGAGRPESQA